ncbi:MAG: DUF2892 domain-containing protein [Firmicutes bacterium]|nr:DUF2892 domain-containing protein [Bacillota bacterium]
MDNNKISWAKIFSIFGLIWLASSFIHPLHVSLGGKMVQINAYPEIYLIPLFGIWRLRTEKQPYQRNRIKWMLGLFFLYWVLLFNLYPKVPFVDGTTHTTYLAVHMVGSLPFFLMLIAVAFMGKRADCGWNCPCVFDRETIGFAFRDATLKGDFWWRFRHIKWIGLITVWGYFVYMLLDPAHAYQRFGETMYETILWAYYLSFLIIPFTGHRSFCRWGCPWAATWGVLNLAGFYKIKADTEKCIDCGLCERECDMGVPIRELINAKGMIRSTECMGCGRCVHVCPREVLTFHDYKDVFKSRNLSPLERNIRLAGGLTVAGLIVLDPGSPWGYLGLAFFFTGLFGFCPTYAMIGTVVKKIKTSAGRSKDL